MPAFSDHVKVETIPADLSSADLSAVPAQAGGFRGDVVVLGCRGRLGTELVRLLRAARVSGSLVTGDLPEADITDARGLRAFLEGCDPSVVFNCAAYTDVDGCESHGELAFLANAEGAGSVAKIASEHGALLVHVSTDFVFDGRKWALYVEDDEPAPLSVYGRSKLEGERLVREKATRWIIARSAWLYGAGGNNFVDRMLSLAAKGDEVAAVTDQVGSPTWTRDLAAALIALAQSGAGGVFHVVNAGACSRYEQVRFALECAGIGTRVRAVSSRAFPRAAAVPGNSALSAEKLAREVGHGMRGWQDALREYIVDESPYGRGNADA